MRKIENIAWLIVFCLLGISGFSQERTVENYVGVWNENASWQDGTMPVANYDNYQIVVEQTSTITSDQTLTFSSNFTSLTVNGTLTVTGDVSFGNGTITIGPSGLFLIKGNLTQGINNSITIEAGGRLVVYGDATIDCNLTINGQLNVSSNFTYDTGKGRNFVVSSTGSLIVGKNLDLGGGSVRLEADSYVGVLGNATFNSNNLPTSAGEVDVIGTYSGTPQPSTVTNTIETQAPADPIFDVIYGMDVIAFLTGPISSPVYATPYSGVIWTSDNYLTGCYLNVILSGEIEFSGGASVGQAYFEFSVDDGYTWDAAPLGKYGTGNLYRKDDINAPSHMVKMRLKANGLPAGETVTISNITIAATNEGGEGSKAIVWAAPPPRDICDGEQAVYEIFNSGVYDDIRWNDPSSPNVEIVSISPNKARCEVKWISSPGTLNVTVTGGSCGGASASITYPINVNEPTAFSASYSKTDISCFGDGSTPNDGSITLSGCGGTGIDPITYLWTDGPGYPFADNTLATQDNLSEGTYKATVTKGSVYEDLEITISRPAELSVSINPVKAFLCDATATNGEFTISYSGGTWPYLIEIKKGSNVEATYDGTTLNANSGTLTWNPGGTLTYSGLGTGTYTVTLTGAVANACPAAIATLEIVHDIVAPTFTTFPANVQMTMAEYQAAQVSMVQPALSVGAGSSLLDGTTPQVIRTLASGLGTLHNMSLKFTATQGGPVPAVGDQLLVEISYDDGSTWPTQKTYSGAISGDQTIALGMDADGKTKAQVRFTATIATAGLTYTVSNVQISGSRFAVSPPTCSDNSSVCSVSYIDSKPQWSDCTGYSNADAEFYIERTWTAVDACGNPTHRKQIISVGTAPTFNNPAFPVDKVYDFCQNNSTFITQTAPDITDSGTCGVDNISWKVVRETSPSVFDEINEGSANGTGNFEGYSFEFPANGDGETSEDYYIVWTVTDQSYNKAERKQKITIKPAIAATITAPNLDNVCKDENVVFTVTPRGGTGTFNDMSFTPAGGTWNGTTYIFTTSLANVKTDETVTVKIQDVAVAGVDGVCNQDVLSPEFDVHDLIPTGGISRE